jgi:L-alanine-DL-glutamate epimerase-like enolase superfamily enzyme
MKIADVRAVIPESPTAPRDWRSAMAQFLAIVETDTGRIGLGVGGGGKAALHIVDTVLREVLIGRDPRDVEQLWDAMYRATMPFGRKGLAVMTLSGLDLALWDLLGKLEHQPVYELLGGLRHERIPAYASIGDTVTDELERGYRHVKLHLSRVEGEPRVVVDKVRAAREQLGPDVPLYTDAAMRWDLDTALQLADAFAPYDVGWLEEPIPADDLAGYQILMQRSPIPIAGGEHEYTTWGYRELLDRRAHAIWQPDACWVGGLTQLKRIFELAPPDIWLVPHRGCEVWGLHAIAALADRPLAEDGRPWITWLRSQPPVIDGHITPPSGPGFGVEVDEALLRRIEE